MALTKATLIDLNSNELALDLDGDTTLHSSTDDQIDIKIAGADDFTFTANAFNALAGSHITLVDNSQLKVGADTDLQIYHDGTNSYIANKTGALKIATETSGIAITIGHTTSEVTIADNVTVTGNINVGGTLTFVDGSIAIADLDVDGGTDIGAAIVDADLFIVDDGAGGTNRKTAASRLLTYAMAGTLSEAAQTNITSLGTLTALTVDDITINGSTISDAGDFTLDVEGDIILDANGGDVFVKDAGTTFGSLTNTSGNLIIKSGTTTAATFSGANVTFAGTVDSGAITSTGVVTGTGFTAGSAVLAEAELELLDGLTAGTAIASKVVTTDANIDTTGQRNLTISGELDAATGDFSGAVDVAGALTTAAITASGIVTGTAFTAGSAVLAEAELELLDGLTAGTAIASKVVTTDANIDTTGMRNLTISGELDAATLDISGNADIDGTTNLDVVDIDGAVDMASTLQVDGAITTSDGMVISTADNTDTLTLTSTDADANTGPNLKLYRNTASPADDDSQGQLSFVGRNDNSQDFTAFQMNAYTPDVSDGTEDGTMQMFTMQNGSLHLALHITPTETVLNDSSKDQDFRVESNGNANCLFVDGGENRVGIGTNAPANTLHVKSTGDPSGDVRLILETSATDGNASLDFYRSDGNIEGNILYDTDDDFMQFNANGAEIMRLKSTSIVFNEGSADMDFRVESNGDVNTLFVNGGTDRVGIKTNAPTKTLGIGGDGVISLEGGSNALTFYDSSALKVYLTSQSFGDHNGDGLGLVTSGDEPHKFFTNGAERLRIEGNGKITTGGEASGDVSDGGGLGLGQGGSDGNILTFKSSDIAHGMIDYDETDTYAAFKKYNGGEGGLGVTGYSESASPGINLYGAITTADTGTAHTDEAAVRVVGALRNGQAVTNFAADDNLFTIMNNTNNQVIVKGDGEIFSNQTATVGVFDTYEDAQLVRAYDLSQGKYKAGLIDSKFDKFVQYNAKDLADANLIGKEKDGTPNSFVNITGMQRLHNGAIWQQYEKTQRLTQAMYKLAVKTLGKEEADKLLDEEEIKLLN